MKKANIDNPSQKLKCIAMTSPKNAPAKCKAKYNAINISFIILILHHPRLTVKLGACGLQLFSFLL